MKNPSKKMNVIFLLMVILYLAASVGLSMLSVRSIEIPQILTLLAGEIVAILPGLIFLVLFRCDLSIWIPIRKVHVGSFFQSVLIGFLIMPTLYFFNVLSQLVERNVAVETMMSLDRISPLTLFLCVGIVGPLCEEVVFRGILLHGFKRTGRVLAAVLWTSFLFGLFHLNLNQMGYAIVLGLVGAFLVEGTGSLLPSFAVHATINSFNVIQLLVTDYVTKALGSSLTEIVDSASSELMTPAILVKMAGAIAVPAIATMAVAVVVFISIARREGRLEYVMSILPKRKHMHETVSEEGIDEPSGDEKEFIPNKKEHVITAVGIIAVLLCIGIIFGLEALVAVISG